MLTTAKNWKLTSYTNDTWTALVNEVATVATVILANTTSSTSITVMVRLSGGAVLLPPVVLTAGQVFTFDVRSLNIITGESLQVNCNAAGMNFVASGAV